MWLLLFAVVVGALAFGTKATGGPRRRTVGKSGRTWFTSTDEAGNTSVFLSAGGDDTVLRYNQAVQGDNSSRRVLFTAPTQLASTAVQDFITG